MRLLRWVKRKLGIASKLTLVRCEELPDLRKNDAIYVVGSDGVFWQACMCCPCGCGTFIQLPMSKNGRPRWSLSVDSAGLVSLNPSVRRTNGCQSHFFVKRGKVIWCTN